MALKYVDTGATFDGDGTASAQAGSAGAAGAWNNLRNVMINSLTYGSYAAGDTINVRTHDGTSDITETFTNTLFVATVGTETNPVTLKFDDGVIWANGGTFKHAVTATIKTNFTIPAGFNIEAVKTSDTVYGYWYANSYTTHANPFISFGSGRFDGIKLTASGGAAGSSRHIEIIVDAVATFKDCLFDLNHEFASNPYIKINDSSYVEYINCIADLSGTVTGSYFIEFQNYGTTVIFRNLKLINTLDTAVFIKDSTTESGTLATGFIYIENSDLGLLKVEEAINKHRGPYFPCVVESETESLKINARGYAYWNKGGFFPVQSATLPDGSGWSLKVLPREINVNRLFTNNSLKKFYNGSAVVITVTQEICIKDTSAGSGAYDNPKNDEWFARLFYIDNATGDTKCAESTQDGSALTSSSITWVPETGGKVTYGGDEYIKYKVIITTPAAVKSDSYLSFQLFSIKPSISADDFYFINPEINIS